MPEPNRSRSHRVRELFLEALTKQTPDEREVWLQNACCCDADLLARVRQLLRSHREDDFLETPAPDLALGDLRPRCSMNEAPEGVVGRYKLLEKLGEGGCGVVFEAEQQEPVRRRIALKLIKAGMDTKSVIARFEAERQVLALMDHPNIAKVFDAGSTENGRPYFVMELVEGVKITDYCAEHSLSINERLALFLQVCDAVQHAHQKGIIHRDLKPSNILVTHRDDAPRAQVIDFGIAKAIHGKLTTETIQTLQQHFLGTPAYMSPEQADLSADIDTRTDIYSLGVLLYQILTGKPPFDNHELLTAGLDEMRRIIREVEPKRPSQSLVAAEVRGRASKPAICIPQSAIDPDLDCIIMKCLEKDRSRRYESAAALGADLHRYVANEPVLARPASAAYRAQKLFRRNKIPVLAGVFTVAALILATAVSSWQAMRARFSERKANEQALVANSIKDFLTGELLGTANPFVEPEPDPNKRPILERIARQLGGKFPTQPLIEAELRHALGDAFKEIGEFEQSAVQFRRCLEIRNRELGLGHSDTLEASAWLAEDFIYLGRKNEAQRVLTPAVEAVRGLRAPFSRGAGWVLFEQGYLLFRDRHHKEADPYFTDALKVLKPLIARERAKSNGPAGSGDYRFGDNSLIEVLAYSMSYQGRTGEAQAMIAQELEESQRRHGKEHALTALLQRTEASLFLAQGQWGKALPILERSVPVHHRVLGTNHFSTLEAEYFLGLAYEQAGKTEAAATLYATLPARWEKYFPYDLARDEVCSIAKFFARHGQSAIAETIYARLKASFATNPSEWSWEQNLLRDAGASSVTGPSAATNTALESTGNQSGDHSLQRQKEL
jgi:serine/threonine protein kinase